MEMPTAYIKRLMQFVRQCDRLNYPAGELQRTRAFSSGSNHGSGHNATSKRGPSSSSHSQQELDTALPNNLGKYTRQISSVKQRKKKGSVPAERRTSSSHQHSNSPTMAANITMSTMAPKRRQGRSHRSNSNTNSIGKQPQQVQAMHHGKYYQSQQQQQQHQSARDQYPSVETNLSTDAAMCGMHPTSVESKYYAQYLQQQQHQQQHQQPNYY